MANPVASVTFVQGQAWAKAPDGSLRPLQLGDQLMADEVVVTGDGARIELDFGEGEPVVIAANQEVGLGPDLWEVSVTDPSEAQLADASVQQALTILEQGGDLLDSLEETAAGGGDAGAGGGNSFVQVERLAAAAAEGQEFGYGDPSFANGNGGYGGGDRQNQAPTAQNLQASVAEDTPLNGRILAADPENDSLTYTLLTPPANGSLTLNPTTGEFVYQPNENYHGDDSFVVVVTDPRGNSATSTVSLEITPVNDAPTSSDQSLQTPEDVPVSGQVVAEDLDGDSLTYSLSGNPANGQVSIDPQTGAFTYTPNPDYHGNDSFVVTIDDGQGDTTTSTINLVVTPVNDAPVASDLSLVTDEDTPISSQVVATDVDGDDLGYTVSTQPTNGTVVIDTATGQFTYTPNQDFNGSDSFVVTIDDGQGGTTTSTVTIGVLPVNDAPVTSNINLVTNEDTPISSQVVATDVDGDSLSYSLSGQPANGSVSLNLATGQFTYTPDASFNGSDSFVVQVSDGNGGVTTSLVTIGVLPLNDAPVAANLNLVTNEDTPISSQVVATDADGDSLSYTLSGQPANGSLSLNPATGQFTYTPNSNYNGSDSFVVTISDGNGGTTTSTVTIGVTPVNNAPVSADQNLTTAEDTPLDGAIVASDIDGDTLAYSLTTGPANGSLVLDAATGTFTYTPDADYNGSDSFVVTISDGNGGTTTSTVTIGVTPVNDPPVSADQNLTTEEDTPLNGAIVASDVDGDTLAYVVSTGPTNGTLVLNPATGSFVYTPDSNYNGSDSFVVTISDGNGGTTTSTVTIGVTPVNNAPVSADQNLTTEEDTPLNGAIVASDVDGDTLAYSLTTGPANGSLELDAATGTFTYTPDADYNGSDSFVVTVSDGNGGTTTSTVTIGVTPVNDPPVTADINLVTNEDTPVSSQVVATDADGDDLVYTLSGSATNGTVVLDAATGEFTYTPDSGFSGSDSFEVEVSDGNGGLTVSLVTVGVLDVTGPSVVVDIVSDILVAGETSVVTFTFSEAISGFELSDLNVTGGGVAGLTGPVVNGDGSATYTATFTPTADFTGTASVAVPAGSYTDLAGNLGSGDSDSVLALENPNNPPVAVDDFGGAGYSVNLVFSTNPATAAWNGVDSTGQSVVVQAFNADGSAGSFLIYGPTSVTNGLSRLGVGGTPRLAGSVDAGQEAEQIEYDPISNTSESVMINLNGLASSGNFSVSNLVATEQGGEIGQWTAYYQGQAVFASSFVLTIGNEGTFTIDTGGLLFDSIGFSALHTVNGAGDGGGYFLTAFSATGPSLDFLVDEGDVLNVSLASGNHLLANDTDPGGDSLSVTHINGVAVTDGSVVTLPSGALLTIFEDGSFSYSPNGAYSELVRGDYAVDTFEYTVADGLGGTDIGQASVTVVGTADPASTDISSTAGADTLLGTLMADTFVWNLGDEGTAGAPVVDVVQNFSASQGDTLDLRDLLVDENSANLSNYLYAETNGTTTTIHISSSGGFAGGVYDASQTDQVIQLQNVHFHQTGTTSEEIINMLKNAGNLLTD